MCNINQHLWHESSATTTNDIPIIKIIDSDLIFLLSKIILLLVIDYSECANYAYVLL